MTEDEKKAASERRKLIGMLQSLYELSEHSTLSGAFKKGAEAAVDHYNRLLARLESQEGFDADLFPPLEPTATFHELGVASKLLRGWLEADSQPEEPHKAFGFHVDLDGLSHLGDMGRKIRDELNFQKTVRVRVNDEEKQRDEEEL